MIRLHETSTLPPEGAPEKKITKLKLKKLHRKLFKLQNKFYADGRYSLLIILQGMDTAGKDGIIRHVIRSMNPMGVGVKAFGVPTEEERQHDFLWRIYPHFPAKGMIQVFNRSYYEDIIVPEINDDLPTEILKHRLDLINKLEEYLELNNTFVLKFFLHISKEEQDERIKNRKTKKHKKWKYDERDETTEKLWNDKQRIYETLLNRCQVKNWHFIPSDKKWYRNYLVAKKLKKFLKGLDLEYPDLNDGKK